MRITTRHWTAALIVALLVHVGLLASLLAGREEEGALAAGYGGIEIGLGPAGGAPGAVAAEAAEAPEAEVDAAAEAASEPAPEETTEAAEVETLEAVEAPVQAPVQAPVEAPVETTAFEVPEVTEMMPEEAVAAVEEATPEVPAPPVAEPLPAELAEPVPVEEALAAAEPPAPAEVQRVEPTSVPPPEPEEAVQAEAVTPPPPRAKPRPPQREETQDQPEPPQTVAKPEPAVTEPQPPTTEAVAEEASSTAPSDTQTAAITPTPLGDGGKAGTLGLPDVGSGDGGSGGGQQAQWQAYKDKIRAWFEKHKKYPRRARLRNQQGTPLIHFEIDQSGAVLVSGIEESSGYRLLDREAMKTIERASPLPKPPQGLQGRALQFTVPMPFTLK